MKKIVLMMTTVLYAGCGGQGGGAPAAQRAKDQLPIPNPQPDPPNSFTFFDPHSNRHTKAHVSHYSVFIDADLPRISIKLNAAVLGANLGFISMPETTLRQACIERRNASLPQSEIDKLEAGYFSLDPQNWDPATEQAALDGAHEAGFDRVYQVQTLAGWLYMNYKFSVALGPLTVQAGVSHADADQIVSSMISQPRPLPIGFFCDLLDGDSLITGTRDNGHTMPIEVLNGVDR